MHVGKRQNTRRFFDEDSDVRPVGGEIKLKTRLYRMRTFSHSSRFIGLAHSVTRFLTFVYVTIRA